MKVAIIPARGGSKRIPKKNIKLFCGQPMISYSIKAAIESNCFDYVIVSTDDVEIANVAIKYGASVPFIRPPELSDDFIGTTPVIHHAINAIEQCIGVKIDMVCCIYPTAPFVQALDIKKGLDILDNISDCEYSFGVTTYAFPIQRAIKIDDSNRVSMFNPEAFNIRSQDLEEAYHDAGQFYWGRRQAWVNELKIFAPYSLPVILPRYRVQDIDTLEDWHCAELMFELIKNRV